MFQIIDLIIGFIHSTVDSLQTVLYFNYLCFISDWVFFMLLRSSLSSLIILITLALADGAQWIECQPAD